MKKTISKAVMIFSLAALFAVEGCDKETIGISTQDSDNVSDEALMDAYFQDMEDLGGVAIAAPDETTFNGGRVSGTIVINDNRFQCNNVVVTLEILDGSTTEVPKGKITVDFGTGCTDAIGNVRKGKVIFTYNGRRYVEGSSVVTTTDNYSINDVKLEGTRTTTVYHVTSATDIEYHVVLENGKATFVDNKIATRQSDLYLRIVKGETAAQDKLIVSTDSNASGTTRNGTSYEVSLSKALEYHRFCPLAVSGVKNISVPNKPTISVDYGTGDCDDTVTITIGNYSRTVTIIG